MTPMQEFLSFRRMITPVIIQILFWVGVVLCVLGGLISIIQGASAHYGGGGAVLGGLLTMLLGPVLVRVYCEILIIFFRINETLSDIRNNTSKAQSATPPSPPPA